MMIAWYSEQFGPLVRLFIGFRRFREMEYILELLMKHDQFELAVSVRCRYLASF